MGAPSADKELVFELFDTGVTKARAVRRRYQAKTGTTVSDATVYRFLREWRHIRETEADEDARLREAADVTQHVAAEAWRYSGQTLDILGTGLGLVELVRWGGTSPEDVKEYGPPPTDPPSGDNIIVSPWFDLSQVSLSDDDRPPPRAVLLLAALFAPDRLLMTEAEADAASLLMEQLDKALSPGRHVARIRGLKADPDQAVVRFRWAES